MIFLYQFICIKTHEYFTYCSKLHSYGWEGGNVTSVKIFFQNEGSKLMPTLSAFMQALHCSKLKGNLIRRGFQEKKKKKKAPSLLVLISSFFCCFKRSSKIQTKRWIISPQWYSSRSGVRHLVSVRLVLVQIQLPDSLPLC